jgi:hypothetical protein
MRTIILLLYWTYIVNTIYFAQCCPHYVNASNEDIDLEITMVGSSTAVSVVPTLSLAQVIK